MQFARKIRRSAVASAALALFAYTTVARPALASSEFDAGPAVYSEHDGTGSLVNRAIEVTWRLKGAQLTDLKLTDRATRKAIAIPSPLVITVAGGRSYRMEDLHFVGKPGLRELPVDPSASRFSDRIPGKEFEGVLENNSGDLRVDFALPLRNNSSYLRELVTITAPRSTLAIQMVRLIDLHSATAQEVGSVDGSPIADGQFFYGFEHPLSSSRVDHDEATAEIRRILPLPQGQSITYSSVYGISRPGQMRRAFLTYIERERAHPYRTFLHTNTWFDITFLNLFDQAAALDEINSIGNQLYTKRGVHIDSFLLDDGWDDYSTVWGFNRGFPQGFTPIVKATTVYDAKLGVWLSPWGGYEEPKMKRVASGERAGFEIVNGGFALSGPKYYKWFRDLCLEMIQKYNVNQFKFDGTGNANTVYPGSIFDSDFDAMIHLIGALRQAKPDIYINLTTGTHASPFWLLYADSVWRGGADTSFAGVGTKRQQWITFRDAETYANVVVKGPLYPLNSIMLHGIVYAQKRPLLDSDPGNDFADEVHSYFGSGTQLQELYLTHSLLSSRNWDDLAESAKWSRVNADILRDTHWVGGDPGKLQVYGWGAWASRAAILVLRNPSNQPQKIELKLADVFELPPGAPSLYTARIPWKADVSMEPLRLNANLIHAFDLAPFQVLTLEMIPK